MNTIHEVIARLLGAVSIVDYIVLSIFIMIGITASIRIDTIKRDRLSPCTPFEFDLKFFLLDNFKRFIKSFVTIFLIIRFGEDITGKELTEWGAVLLGLGFDQIGGVINQKLENFKKEIRERFKDN